MYKLNLLIRVSKHGTDEHFLCKGSTMPESLRNMHWSTSVYHFSYLAGGIFV